MRRLMCFVVCSAALLSLGPVRPVSSQPPPAKEIAPAPRMAERAFQPVAVFTGTFSAIKKERFEVVRTSAEWEKLWAEHRGKGGAALSIDGWPSLSVDFESHVVVAIFVGGGSEECFITPRLRVDTIVIGFRPFNPWRDAGVAPTKLNYYTFPPAPGPDHVPDFPGKAVVPETSEQKAERQQEVIEQEIREKIDKERSKARAPYSFVILRKPMKQIVIEEDVKHDRMGSPGPSVWKERKVFLEVGDTK